LLRGAAKPDELSSSAAAATMTAALKAALLKIRTD
jgi:hypothetical protein